MRTHGAALALVVIALLAVAAPAAAQIEPIPNANGTLLTLNGGRGDDIAFDPSQRVFLAVDAALTARFMNESGGGLSSSFTVAGPGTYQFPNVCYSANVNGGAGGFVVTWIETTSGGSPIAVHARIVAYPATLVSSDVIVSTIAQIPSLSSGASISYSATSQKFLVMWESSQVHGIFGAVLGLNLQTLSTLTIASSPSVAAYKYPSIAWNSATDEWGVSFSGSTTVGNNFQVGAVFAAPVSAAGVAGQTRVVFTVANNSGADARDMYATAMQYNSASGRYVMAWYEINRFAPEPNFQTTVLDRSMNRTAGVQLVSTLLSGGGVPFGFSYNATTGTFLIGGLDKYGSGCIAALELDPNGMRLGSERCITSPNSGNRLHPRLAAATGAPTWALVYTDTTTVTRGQAVRTTTPWYSNPFLNITDATPAVITGQAFSSTYVATGGSGSYSFSSSALPPGVTLSSGGVLSGRATAPGVYSFTLQVNDNVAPFASGTRQCTMTITAGQPVFVGPISTARVVADFNRDGRADILVRNAVNGNNQIEFLDGRNVIGRRDLPAVSGFEWQLVGGGDFDGDGWPDVLWRNLNDGSNLVWYLNNGALVSAGFLTSVTGTAWQVAAVADFDRDGSPDVLWRNPSTGEDLVWYLRNRSIVRTAFLPTVGGGNWMVAGSGDFNGDGSPDLIWRDPTHGDTLVWYLNNGQITGTVFLPSVADPNWEIAGTGDFDGDGRADILWANPVTAEAVVWFMAGTTLRSSVVIIY